MYDTSTLGTCANVKTAGKTVYTIQVNTNGDPQSALLRNCATTTDKFWMVTTGGALNEVFKQIGTELSSLRLAL
jgi:glycine cleavage system aminomethyltransferase T